MSSYDSNRSGYLHPQYQQQPPQPPYPTTPCGPPSQAPNYFPPIPEQQPVYSSSPAQQPFYSPSPTSPRGMMPQPASSTHRRTSSTSSHNSQRLQPATMPMPIPTRQPLPSQYNNQHAASYPPQATSYPPPFQQYATSPQSHHRSHPYANDEYAHNPHSHSFADSEEQYRCQSYGELDPETEREYKRRYAKEKAFERRPTLGGSLLSMVGKVGRAIGGPERR
jgi:hypothetical protein